MTGFYLLPRLSIPIAQALAQDLGKCPIAACRERRAVDHPGLRYDPLRHGLQPIPAEHLRKLADALTEAAESAGYPETAREDGSGIDNVWAVILHSTLPCTFREAASEETWAFLTCILVPDLVRWRWREVASPDALDRWVRTSKAHRNCFGRLWRRAAFTVIEGPDPYSLTKTLVEDEAQQLVERPSLLGCRSAVRELIVAAQKHAEYNPIRRSRIIREGAKHLLRRAALVELDALDASELSRTVSMIVASILPEGKQPQTGDTTAGRAPA